MGESSKNHHYLPEVFIKNFAKNGKVQVVDLEEYKKIQRFKPDIVPFVKSLSPGAICYIPNLHLLDETFKMRFPDYTNFDGLIVEDRILGKLETRYGKILRIVLDEKKLDVNDAKEFISFLISLKLRNPYEKQNYKPIMSYVKSESVKSLVEKVLKSYPNLHINDINFWIDSILEEYSNDPSFREHLFKGGILKRHLQGGLVEGITTKLLSFKWHLLEAPIGSYFISSDNPGFSISGDKSFNTKYDSNFSFYLPISSKICFYVTDDNIDDKMIIDRPEKHFTYQIISEQTVKKINDLSIQYRYRYVFSKHKKTLIPLLHTLSKE